MTVTFAAGITTLRLDVTGDGRADYQMKINGDVTEASGDGLLWGRPGSLRGAETPRL